MQEGKRHVAIVLAAGKGSRMKSDVPKQYLGLNGKPVLYYALRAFEDSFIDEIVLVTGAGQESYCQSEIVEKYGFQKVTHVIAGGKERYDSVYRGICALEGADYVYIHDGARPFIDAALLSRARETVEQYHACAAGMPSKDTIKLIDDQGFVTETPQRKYTWTIQTPQVFDYPLIREAYERMYQDMPSLQITDDAMVVETMLQTPVKLYEGSYDNIKITTPEDLIVAEAFLA
ncbi:2-C-methyl-D-erythritol 4-phosphate cytidylyltransferase [uncultured Eubacterium sp.]|uniref:2-C-methyl-D-erythritol 4-phosphate cytidylyltransferase n=1 Tax=uncultured Eubacterium sp. TaxID=165185 RepID=UPI0025E96EBD|nr:2-C-methyl-D-erythritol 4-phosphate cytidylyltransferase [uncultured Eubacterium sp.]MCI6537934.1 2-C-methyl-D-erythritol 4-phosphate cytidylyltransferase [Lachnospiraceae bacterium]